MKKNIKLISLLSLALIGGLLTSCGSNKDSGSNFPDEEEIFVDGDKIVYTVDLSFETDSAKELEIEVRGKISELGGFVAYTDETKGENYFISYVTYKIPVENLDDFEMFVDSKDSLVSKNKTAKNISGEYIYNETTIEALEDKLELYNSKYLETTDLDQQLALLDKIAEIEGEIAKQRKSIEIMNNKLSYSTINATYRSTYEPSRKAEYLEYLGGLGSDVLWSLAYAAPFLLLAGVGVTIFACCKKKKLEKNK